jgi:hypothetical protein
MSQENQTTQEPKDAAESVVPYIHWVIPLVGAANIFLIAFIAVFMT